MGTDPHVSVTNPDGRFHYVENAYVAGPALFPTVGSPNPMLTGTALARRTADVIVDKLRKAREASKPPIEPQFTPLFDGTDTTFRKWQVAGFRPPGPATMPMGGYGPGYFRLADESIIASATEPYGVFYFATEVFSDFILRLQFRVSAGDNNSGIFLRFRDPQLHWPDLEENGPTHAPLSNRARIAEFSGFEVQIDDQALPDHKDKQRTGAIYGIEIGSGAGQQAYQSPQSLSPGRWNFCEIDVRGATYVVRLNGRRTTTFTNPDENRGQPATQNTNSGFVGIQAHTGEVAFRNIRLKRL
jgi:hypothetical protein